MTSHPTPVFDVLVGNEEGRSHYLGRALPSTAWYRMICDIVLAVERNGGNGVEVLRDLLIRESTARCEEHTRLLNIARSTVKPQIMMPDRL